MSTVVRWAIPGREYPPGEVDEVVVDPHWEQHGTVRQVQQGRTIKAEHGTVLIELIGEPRDEPEPPSAAGREQYERIRRLVRIAELARLTVKPFDPRCGDEFDPQAILDELRELLDVKPE